ncbi:MAG: hypothetical protein QOD84_943 [Acidobacteriaceae bacterium]|jgi:hypothetical protein
MVSGDAPGLQNRRAAAYTVVGGFDSHSLPPFIFSHVGLSAPQRITLRSWLKVVVVINS